MNAAKKEAEVARQIEELAHMTVGELQQRWEETWGEPCRSRNKRNLQKRVAWRIQELAYGGLSERALRRATELADETMLRGRPPRGFMPGAEGNRTTPTKTSPAPTAELVPGTVLTREYNGRRLVVMVLNDGFEFEGQRYRSLTAIADAVTGSHWNGRNFFGLPPAKSAKP